MTGGIRPPELFLSSLSAFTLVPVAGTGGYQLLTLLAKDFTRASQFEIFLCKSQEAP